MTVVAPLIPPRNADTATGGQRRVDLRNNMFVIAALASGEGSAPVRIRNMSRGGALIEGPVLPVEGSPLRLSRGSLSVMGRIAWRRDGRAGIRFDCSVVPVEWLPQGTSRTGQQRVDEIVYTLKNQTGVHRADAAAEGAESPNSQSVLGEISDMLRRAAEELANGLEVTARHSTALQLLDVAAQKADKLAAELASPSAAAV